MKKLNYLLSAVILLAVLVTVGCSKDDGGPSAEQQVIDRFAKTWTLTSASYDDGNVTDLSGLTLTLSDNFSYSTGGSVTRTPHPWPSSGTWSFTTPITDAAASSFSVTRDDGLVMSVELTDTTLTLNFNFEEGTHSQTGRTEGIDGQWSMQFGG
jgi:hypothetical protein